MRFFNLFILALLLVAGQIMAQNPYWSFAPKYVNFSTGGVVSTLGAGTKSKNGLSNAIFSKAGNLLMYGTAPANPYGSNYFLNASDGLNSLENSAFWSADAAYFPVPEVCNSYLVPSTTIVLGNGSQGENINYENDNRPGYIRVFRLLEVDFSDDAGHFCTFPVGNYFADHQNGLGMAAPITPSISGSARKPYLYLARVTPKTVWLAPNYYRYESNEINIDIMYGQSGTLDNRTSFTVANTSPDAQTSVREVDLSFDGTKLAFSLSGKNVIYLINNVANCVDGTCSSSNLTSITVSSATAVNGVEFSPDGSKLFYTKSTSSSSANQIGYVDLASMAQSDVASSANLGASFLEYALDGYMYVSDGSNLKGFTMNAPYTVSKTIANVPNSQFNGVYTLPDQVDGGNYATLGGDCQTGSVSYTSTTLPSLTKVNGTITASGSTSVLTGTNVTLSSSSSVALKPNFSAKSGSAFKASIAPCTYTCVTNGCTSTNYRVSDEEEAIGEAKKSSTVHPNPINAGQLYFGRTVGYYSLKTSTGILLQQGSDANKLDITGLSKGLYMLQLDNKTEKVIVE